MALPNVNVVISNGGLARPQVSDDGISGIIFYSTATTLSAGKYQLFSPDDSSSVLGITGDTLTGGQVLKYHIDEYFRNSQSSLYISVVKTGTTTYSELLDLKNFSNGTVKQVGIFDADKRYVSTSISAIQGQADQAELEYAPLQTIYSSRLASGATVETLIDIHQLTCPKVSYVIGDDFTDGSRPVVLRASGATLVGTLGTTLGIVSKAAVNESIGWIAAFNLVQTGYSTVGFIDGSLYTDKSTTLLNTLDSFGYIFCRQLVGASGTWFNYGWTADLVTSDFSTIENNRTIQKCSRQIRTALLPSINSPLNVDAATGQIAIGTIQYFKTLVNGALNSMVGAGELSGFSVSIDPTQNVLSTSKLVIGVKVVPVGVAREIQVNLGFSLTT
jgi:hypothetical protein